VTRFFVAKAWLAGTGLVVGLAGIAWERPWLVWAAIALLAGTVLLRLAERTRGARGPTW